MSKVFTPRVGVFIGRMQPIHQGHLNVLRLMADECDIVVIGIGSANKARSIKNPLLPQEREMIIDQALLKEDLHSKCIFKFAHLFDFTYNNEMWLEVTANTIEDVALENYAVNVHTILQKRGLSEGEKISANPDIVLYGYDQGADTTYLHQFPQWGKELVGKTVDFHATDIRRKLFFDQDPSWTEMVASGTEDLVQDLLFGKSLRGKTTVVSQVGSNLLDEASLVTKIKKDKAQYTYPIIDQTVDAVVICNGHVLMVTRGVNPGKGQWALPGGYLNEFESFEDGIIRELVEETKIALKPSLLRNLLNGSTLKQYGAPGRSVRGRVITNCGLIHYRSNRLPEVKGSDDAAKAEWIPLTRLDSLANNIFEDHYCIIRNMLGYC